MNVEDMEPTGKEIFGQNEKLLTHLTSFSDVNPADIILSLVRQVQS